MESNSPLRVGIGVGILHLGCGRGRARAKPPLLTSRCPSVALHRWHDGGRMRGAAPSQSSMHSVSHSVTRRGGLAATHELHSDGWGRGAIRTAVRAGDVIRVRQGWYASRGIPPLVLSAVRVGGRLTCTTALSVHGCWELGDARLHVTVDPSASRLRLPHDKRARLADQPAGVRVHWRASTAEERLVLPPLECFVDAIGCLTDDLVLVLVDSYLRAHPRGRRGLEPSARWVREHAFSLRPTASASRARRLCSTRASGSSLLVDRW